MSTAISMYPRQPTVAVRYGPELRVLIVGGGVAGLTLAGLLEQRQFAPTVVERDPAAGSDHGASGCGDGAHVLSVWPAGSRVLKSLGLFPAFCRAGLECTHYKATNAAGETLHTVSLEPLARKYGPLVDISRPDLIEILRGTVPRDRMRYGVTVQGLVQRSDGIVALFDDGSSGMYDVVVGCDGVRSRMRRLLFGDAPPNESGITGWTFSLPLPFIPPPEVVEYWGTGKFFGFYPARDRVCAHMCAREPAGTPDPVETRVERIRECFRAFGGMVPWMLGELTRGEDIAHTDYLDVRSGEWFRGRAVLIGDAAHAVQPIGVMGAMGASLAMESAAVLAEELSRADSSSMSAVLSQYAARRRARVDHVQAHSRLLGRLMYTGNRLLAKLRDAAARMIADEQFLHLVDGMMAERI